MKLKILTFRNNGKFIKNKEKIKIKKREQRNKNKKEIYFSIKCQKIYEIKSQKYIFANALLM